MEPYASSWNNNTYIVPFPVLQHFLSINELTKITKLNSKFKDMVFNKTAPFIMKITSVSHGISVMRTFKNCELALELIPNNKDADLSQLSSLTNLTVKKLQVTNQELTNLKRMRSLTLHKNKTVTDYGLSEMQFMTSLSLVDNEAKITNGLFKKFTNLRTLDLSSHWFLAEKYFGDKCLKYCQNLTDLNLTACEFITDAGLMNVTNLTKLNICNNIVITDNGICHMIGLKELNCGVNSTITDAGIVNLISLQTLSLFDNANN